MQGSTDKITIPRLMLQSATKRAYRAAQKNITWQEARDRGKAWCYAMLTGNKAWGWRQALAK